MSSGTGARHITHRLYRGISMFAWLISLLTLQAAAGAAQGAPEIFYSDLDSSPPAAFVTIWGTDFGSEPGIVAVGEATVDEAAITTWSDGMIEFRVPPGSGNGITVRNRQGEESNEVPFVTRPDGKIYFISARDGSNKFDGLAETAQGGKTGPWRDLSMVRKLKPGDVVYVRDGTYDEVLFYGIRPTRAGAPGRQQGRNTTHFSIKEGYSGSPGKPVAVVAYPGEKPTIGGPEARAVFFEGGVTDFTLAKFQLEARQMAIGMSPGPDFFRIRIVANSARDIIGPSGIFQIESCSACKILGNHVSHSGMPGNKFSHLIYYGGFGVGENLEIAWNLLHDHPGGRGIQLYGHAPEDRLSGVSIHDNVIFNCARDGILVGGSDGPVKDWIRDAVIYNNIVYNVGGAGIRIANDGADARVLHNTLVGNGISLLVQRAKSVEVHNNIFAGDGSHVVFGGMMPGHPPGGQAPRPERSGQPPPEWGKQAPPEWGKEPRPEWGRQPRPEWGNESRPEWERRPRPHRGMGPALDMDAVKISHNGYEGDGDVPEQDTNPIRGAAGFNDPRNGDFSLGPESDFRQAGTQLQLALPGMTKGRDVRPDLGAPGRPAIIGSASKSRVSGQVPGQTAEIREE